MSCYLGSRVSRNPFEIRVFPRTLRRPGYNNWRIKAELLLLLRAQGDGEQGYPTRALSPQRMQVWELSPDQEHGDGR